MSGGSCLESDAHLLRVPCELRGLIYHDALSVIDISITIQRDLGNDPATYAEHRNVRNFPAALFLTCRQIYRELSALLSVATPQLSLQAELSQSYDIKSLVSSIPPACVAQIPKMSINVEASWALNASILSSVFPSIQTLEIRLGAIHQHLDYCDQDLKDMVLDEDAVAKSAGRIHEAKRIHNMGEEIKWLPNAYMIQTLTEHLSKTKPPDPSQLRDDRIHNLRIVGRQTVILGASGRVLGQGVRNSHGLTVEAANLKLRKHILTFYGRKY